MVLPTPPGALTPSLVESGARLARIVSQCAAAAAPSPCEGRCLRWWAAGGRRGKQPRRPGRRRGAPRNGADRGPTIERRWEAATAARATAATSGAAAAAFGEGCAFQTYPTSAVQ